MSSYSRKLYIEVAKIISDAPADEARSALAYRFAAIFKIDNPRFDFDRFMIACGVKGNSDN